MFLVTLLAPRWAEPKSNIIALSAQDPDEYSAQNSAGMISIIIFAEALDHPLYCFPYSSYIHFQGSAEVMPHLLAGGRR